MQEQELACAKRLNDEALVAKLTCCVREDRELTARLLIQLGEVDARGLFRDLGFSSMFDYAVQALHMSESEAWLRLRAARFAREFPAALGMVARGELHMTALKLLAPRAHAVQPRATRQSPLQVEARDSDVDCNALPPARRTELDSKTAHAQIALPDGSGAAAIQRTTAAPGRGSCRIQPSHTPGIHLHRAGPEQ